MSLGVSLGSLVVGVPVVRWLVNRDVKQRTRNPRKSLVKRHSLNLAILIALSLFAYPFVAKPQNHFERFHTIISADPSTVYQQFRRSQVWVEDQVSAKILSPDLGDKLKAENERIHKILHSPTNRNLYIKFGDLLKGSSKSIEEPGFLFCTGYAFNFVLWMGSAVALVGYFLPPGGLLACILILLAMFAVEIESRFVDSESIQDYFFFLNASQWGTFEIIVAMKQAYVGVVCGIVILATLFSTDHQVDKAKVGLRNLLKSNAALVAVIKDPSIVQTNSQPDEVYDGTKSTSINKIVITVVAGIGLIAALIPSGST